MKWTTYRPWCQGLPVLHNIVRLAYLAAGLFGLFFGLIPAVIYGIFNTGVFLLLLGGVGYGGLYLIQPWLHEKYSRLYGAVLWGTLIFLAVVGVIYFSFGYAYRSYCAENPPPEGEVPQTVIVLGGAIEGDEPKLMLQRRLDSAKEYLDANPKARCIVAGGQGPDEEVSEAFAMQKYLVQLGVDPERILLEDQSSTTKENIAYSAKIIDQARLSRDVTVVTDPFHQLRAGYFCQENGLTPHALTSLTPWGLLPSYEIRELGAWVKALMGL